jgi:hypothetical protein
VESLSPHRVPAVDVDDSLFDELEAAEGRRQKDAVGGGEAADFVAMVLDNLRRSGAAGAQGRSPGVLVHRGVARPLSAAQGQARQSSDGPDMPERRVAIFVGPEYGTVSRADLTAAAREAMEAGFDLLVAAAASISMPTPASSIGWARSPHRRRESIPICTCPIWPIPARATCSPCLANPTLPCTMKARA